MGLFQHKQDSNKKPRSPIVKVFEDEKNFFDEDFRAELREHARKYFEKTIEENAAAFKKELDSAVAEVTTDLKTHSIQQLDGAITEIKGELREYSVKKLDERFVEYGKEMKDAQNSALESINHTATDLQEQYKQLSETLKKSIADQESTFNNVAKENSDRIATMKDSQDAALDLLNKSAQALQEQYQQLRTMLQKNIVDQENMILSAFEDNMAQIVEHYLLGALGDQFDLKAQLPSIIKQLEENKQAMSDDMKL